MCSEMWPEGPVQSVRGPRSDHRRARVSVRVPRTGRPRAGGPVCSRSAAVQGGPSSARRIHSRIHSAPAVAEGWGPMRQCRRRVASAHGAPSQGAEWRLGSPSQSGWRGAWAQRPGTSLNTAQKGRVGFTATPIEATVRPRLRLPPRCLQGPEGCRPVLPGAAQLLLPEPCACPSGLLHKLVALSFPPDQPSLRSSDALRPGISQVQPGIALPPSTTASVGSHRACGGGFHWQQGCLPLNWGI